jgi:hypothetical protein
MYSEVKSTLSISQSDITVMDTTRETVVPGRPDIVIRAYDNGADFR